MNKNSVDRSPAWVDPDDAPEITDEWIEEADLYEGNRLIRRGCARLAGDRKVGAADLGREKDSQLNVPLTADEPEMSNRIPLTDSTGEVRELTESDAKYFKPAGEALPPALCERLGVTPSEKRSAAEPPGSSDKRLHKMR